MHRIKRRLAKAKFIIGISLDVLFTMLRIVIENTPNFIGHTTFSKGEWITAFGCASILAIWGLIEWVIVREEANKAELRDAYRIYKSKFQNQGQYVFLEGKINNTGQTEQVFLNHYVIHLRENFKQQQIDLLKETGDLLDWEIEYVFNKQEIPIYHGMIRDKITHYETVYTASKK
jgi:hypothetical protein